MLSCPNAIRPPTNTATNMATIKYRRLTARATRRSIQIEAFNEGSAAGCGAVDEQRALGDDPLAGLQIADYLDEVAIAEAGLDLTQLDRLVRMRNPDPDLVAFIDQRLLRHPDRRMVARRIDGDVGEHFRLQQEILVVDGGADHEPACRWIDRGGDVIELRRERTARQRQHVEGHLLPDRDIRGIGLADEGRHPDGGEIADHIDGVAGPGVDVLARADLALNHGAGDRRENGGLRIDATLLLEG